ncbi:c-type cytochrome [Campylobacter vicugnae]|uniref:c-type cytochrome n=1 Tax=Campylobacter vicugnae TaxID=1660076 RepID=UPI000A33D241|nr:c-type cytochrome [Campylobacter sp. S0112]
MKIAKWAIPLLIASNLIATNDSYIIEADGEFGKELKALVEKHATDNNLSVKVYENSNKQPSKFEDDEDDRFINIGINKNANYNSDKGKELYDKNCKSCHGEKGTKRAMSVSERLSDMSGDDIADSMAGYRGDAQYGGRLKYLMRPIAIKMSLKDLGHIIAYLKGDNAFAIDDDENDDIKTTPTTQGSYLE